MLLTYEEFAEIPDKMHMFYSQAFDTLYQKHDAQKEQYQRRTHAGLTREDFKSCFATFCAMSYLEQNYSFDEATLLETARNAVNYSKQTSSKQTSKAFAKVTPKQFIDDLRESVCMLQADGLEMTFVHRSFQEYFAALFVTNVHGSTAKKIVDEYALRFGDSVMTMALDMDREAIEKEWVLPSIAEFEQLLDLSNRKANNAVRFSKLFPKTFLIVIDGRIHPSYRVININLVGPFQALCRMYPNLLDSSPVLHFLQGITLEAATKFWLDETTAGNYNYEKLRSIVERDRSHKGTSRGYPEIHIQAEDEWWLNAAGANKAFVELQRGFKKVRDEINSHHQKRLDILGSRDKVLQIS